VKTANIVIVCNNVRREIEMKTIISRNGSRFGALTAKNITWERG